ncbi:MAG: DUF2934 domain-containing protein [Bryobacterales bacterium]|jgi:hypothetical protein|nr:DUF2934 domain-containing protein [Bryobacterales bacterium]
MSKKKQAEASVGTTAGAKAPKVEKGAKVKVAATVATQKKARAKKSAATEAAETAPPEAIAAAPAPAAKTKAASEKTKAAPGKSKAVKAKGQPAPEVIEAPSLQPATSTAPAVNGAAKPSLPPISPDEIARLAYSFAEARGFVGGSPEADWLRAEAELRGIRGL